MAAMLAELLGDIEVSETEPFDLQDAFLRTMGKPIPFGTETIVQADRWQFDGPAVVEVRFLNDAIVKDQSIRLSFKKKGMISLTDGQKVRVLEVFDDKDLPRFARHFVEANGEPLFVYNAYSVERGGRTFWESWTQNAGIIVTPLAPTKRLYECSTGSGNFDRNDLKFEVSILPADAPWLPKEIY